VTLVSESSWYNHLHNVFRRGPVSQPATQTEQHRHVKRWTGTESAMGSLMGRRHNNTQPLGPHPFNMPEDNELRTLIATHISEIKITYSPGFNTITPTLNVLANACLANKMRKGGKVLVPHIAALFKLLITTANIPRSWKETKLTPIHKKGPETQPGDR